MDSFDPHSDTNFLKPANKDTFSWNKPGQSKALSAREMMNDRQIA